MKALIFILLAQLALSEETEGSSDGFATDDRWCLSAKNCWENNVCRNNECIPMGRGKMADLENCVEIEVKGLDKFFTKQVRQYNWMVRLRDRSKGPEKFITADGVYSIMKEKSSNGGKVYKQTVVPEDKLSLWRDFGKKLLYLYWDTSRKTWTFDETLQTERNSVVARSKETANENVGAKQFSLWENGFRGYKPASVTCKKYLGDAEDSEMEEDQLAAENKRLQETNRALRQALNEMAV